MKPRFNNAAFDYFTIPMSFYCFSVFLVFISSCSTVELSMPKDLKDNNHSSKVAKREFNDGLIRFLNYRAYKITDISSSYEDSSIRPGIILAGESIKENYNEKEMQFGNESGKCIIHYNFYEKYLHKGRSATMSIINLFSKKSEKVPQQTEDYIIDVQVNGIIKYPEFETELPFSFEKNKGIGYLLINQDSLSLSPVMEGIKKNGKLVKEFMGLQLMKGTIVYAALQLSPNKIFLYTKASVAEQMVIAAYFAIIAKYW